jgi:WD40 repeat protein
MLSIMDGTSKY